MSDKIRGYDTLAYQGGQPFESVLNPWAAREPLPQTVRATRELTEEAASCYGAELSWATDDPEETRGWLTYRGDGVVERVIEIRLEPIGYDDETYADLPDAKELDHLRKEERECHTDSM